MCSLYNLTKTCNSQVWTCGILEHVQVYVTGTSALTWQSLLWLSFTFKTVLHTSAALDSFTTCAVAQCGCFYRVLEHA
jgi:hypothetical protein